MLYFLLIVILLVLGLMFIQLQHNYHVQKLLLYQLIRNTDLLNERVKTLSDNSNNGSS